jgi:hypothetical protein
MKISMVYNISLRVCQTQPKSYIFCLKVTGYMFRLAMNHHQASYSHLITYKMACVHMVETYIAYKILK